MKNSIFKIGVILVIIFTMTMANFIFVGKGLISYAVDKIATNHQNVEFEAYFKDKEGNKITTLEKEDINEEIFLYFNVDVKKEGYFNGEISLENSNFVLKESNNEYVNKIEGNTIYLNQISVGVAKEIQVKIEPIRSDDFEIGLLNMVSKINLKGIYRDRTERNINIKATRELTYKIAENNTSENVENNLKVITNKVVKVDGEEKRIVQFLYNVGLKENNYPVKEININIAIPKINDKYADTACVSYFNNMKSFKYNYDGKEVKIQLTNEKNEEGKVNWKAQGVDTIVLTCIYEKDANLENVELKANQKVTLYNDKVLEAEGTAIVESEELDNIIQIDSKNTEESIYKGKLNAGIERQYQSETTLKTNYVSAIENIELVEEPSQYITNVIYNQTSVKKEKLIKLFGENAELKIYDQNGDMLGSITANSEEDEKGNINLSYEGKNVTGITIKTTKPEKEGALKLTHKKTIQDSRNVVKEATTLTNKVTAKYNINNGIQETLVSMELKNTETESKLELSREDLSTIVANNVEMRVVLLSNNEKYTLYKNPKITINLPEQVENVEINSIDLLYEDELKIKNYSVNGKTITIELEGEQTRYHEDVVGGATIILNTTINVNKKSATANAQIQMMYTNESETKNLEKQIKIIAPKDITTIYSIQDLGIETLGEEKTTKIMMEKSAGRKEVQAKIEVINNNENSIENVKILGDLPTNSNNNNMGIELVKGISIQGIENAQVYYSENPNATDDLNNKENAWTSEITDNSKTNKFLITIENIPSQSSLQGIYNFVIPENLEYNKIAKTGYTVKNTDSITKVENEVTSTVIDMETGVGPIVEAKLTATRGGEEIKDNVKNGEVIRYNVQVSNTGTEDITGIIVKGNVPEGTTLVEPEENYEYIGAAYYKELESRTYETTIETLKIGEVKNISYEVRVNNNTEIGTKLAAIAEIKYGEVTKQTQEVENITANGNIRVTVKRVTDNSIGLYSTVQYMAIVENISNEKQENIKVKTNLPDHVTVERLAVLTDMQVEKIKTVDNSRTDVVASAEATPATISNKVPSKMEVIEYSSQVDIGALEPGQNKVLNYNMLIDRINEDTQVNFSVEVEQGKETYKSNQIKDNMLKNVEVQMSMTANPESAYVKAGDTIEYNIAATNKISEPVSIDVKDSIPEQLTVTEILVNGEKMQDDELNSNDTLTCLSLDANGTSNIQIKTIVNYSDLRETAEVITNTAIAESRGEAIATTESINHIIEANETENEEKEDPSTPNTPSTPENPNSPSTPENPENPEDHTQPTTPEKPETSNENNTQGKRIITGVAWYDKNGNGQKESGEEVLKDIKVKLLNTKTNKLVRNSEGEVLETTTNEKGIFLIEKLEDGEYIVLFEYDNVQYGLTKYKVAGVSETENSDVLLNELLIENENKQVASTDIIKIDSNISGINIGLIKLQNFDLKLNKYVNKVLIQNANGTTVMEYDSASLAKAEIPGKELNGTTVIIEYTINVTNNGEIEGYAKKVADYIPADLRFSSELNKDWYQVGNTLYTEKLANEKIKAGETKTLKLTLTKTMTENNTGSIPNIAEIVEDYNELGIKDTNSTPGNRAKTENDYSTAETIISVKTGEVIYTGIIVTLLVGFGIAAVIIVMKKKSNKGLEI